MDGKPVERSWAIRASPGTDAMRNAETCWLADHELDAMQTLAFISLCYEYAFLKSRAQKGHADERTCNRIFMLTTLLKSEPNPDREERRAYLRKSLSLRAMIKGATGERSVSVRDGSVGGFFVQSKQILRVGSTVRVTIVFGVCLYVFRCKVVRAGAEDRTYGLRILERTI